ncbi:hypothetical protein [Flavobacterium sp.]|uniref:hypothetical protein n=1 Tax=Flavobacterium sp. TaxID=239 RepID=UPI00122B6872|nr:hypothetical protein [Flavobacterium sp.]RZJ70245.1 MAG: hypothetical protein EOO49_14775 [Flavobacterium sp.]
MDYRFSVENVKVFDPDGRFASMSKLKIFNQCQPIVSFKDIAVFSYGGKRKLLPLKTRASKQPKSQSKIGGKPHFSKT